MLTSRKHLALAFLIVGIYALCYSAIKFGLTFAPELRFAALRSALAGGVLLAAAAVSGHTVLLRRRLWGGTLALALLGTSIGYAAMFMSPGRTGAGISSVLGNTGPLIMIVLAARFLEEPITRPKAWSLLLGTIGVTLIALPAIADPATGRAAGFLLPLVSAAAASGATVLLKRLEVGDSLVQVAGWQLVIGALPLTAASVIFERQAAIDWNVDFIAILLFLALVGTAFALSLWYWLVQREDVGQLSLLFFLIPVLGLVLAASIFGERIGPVEAAGVALTLVGIGVVLRTARRETATGGSESRRGTLRGFSRRTDDLG